MFDYINNFICRIYNNWSHSTATCLVLISIIVNLVGWGEGDEGYYSWECIEIPNLKFKKFQGIEFSKKISFRWCIDVNQNNLMIFLSNFVIFFYSLINSTFPFNTFLYSKNTSLKFDDCLEFWGKFGSLIKRDAYS